ncbi:uncharacterized mitochondrial protein AtMg00810-like [Prosopis cineraria]|uniref:uncharacterized mitochondrial protein AtMg00810-like n=1 Tax=Prosopis cineraria TaxID=364024 RepID=UPI002410B54D|nr:uncharacterized mitochondrial protein AtMg00810-like [Prosopis cineraria]
MLLYVDDILLAINNQQHMNDVKAHLHGNLSMTDLGPLKYFLGIEVTRWQHGFILSQRKFALNVLKDTRMEPCRPSAFPIEQNCKLTIEDDEPCSDLHQYRRLVRRLFYLTITYPDITFAVNILIKFNREPKKSYMDALERVLRYIKMTLGQGIFLSSTRPSRLEAYNDANWVGC